MSARRFKPVVLATLLAVVLPSVVHAQFQFFAVNGPTETPVPPLYKLGTVTAGDTVSFPFRLRNVTNSPAVVSTLTVMGVGFSLRNDPTLPLTLQAQASVDFNVAFQAFEPGTHNAALSSQGTSALLVIDVLKGQQPPNAQPPKPRITISLPQTQSLQQGAVTVTFDAPAQLSGSGTVILQFQPSVTGPNDAAIGFASGSRTAPFAFASGDTSGNFGGQPGALFQTGTTTGALTLTAQIGTVSDQQTVAIAPAAVGVTEVAATRSAGSIEVRLTGFDNTRSVGRLGFTFFDIAAKPIAQGTIETDAGAAFTQFFQTSDAGGTFLLRAVFPVIGDASQIGSFEATLTNSAGAALTARTPF